MHFNIINSSDEFFWKTSIWVIFWNLLYGLPWWIPKTFPIMWLSPNIFKHNSKTNYLIPKFNHLNYFLIFPFLLTISILIIISFFFRPHQYIDMKRQINMCLFMSKLFILIKIKIDIYIYNEELLETMWKHKKKNVDLHQ
jgi:hypothetical protein